MRTFKIFRLASLVIGGIVLLTGCSLNVPADLVRAYLECDSFVDEGDCRDEYELAFGLGNQAVPVLAEFVLEGPPADYLEQRRVFWLAELAEICTDQKRCESFLDMHGYESEEDYIESEMRRYDIKPYRLKAAGLLVAIGTPEAEETIYAILASVDDGEVFMRLLEITEHQLRFETWRSIYLVRTTEEMGVLARILSEGWSYATLPSSLVYVTAYPLRGDLSLGVFYDIWYREDGFTGYYLRFEHSPYQFFALLDEDSDGRIDRIHYDPFWLGGRSKFEDEMGRMVERELELERPSYKSDLFEYADQLGAFLRELSPPDTGG